MIVLKKMSILQILNLFKWKIFFINTIILMLSIFSIGCKIESTPVESMAFEGYGSLYLTINWDNEQYQSVSITGKLESPTNELIEFELPDGVNIFGKNSIPAGNYSLNIILYTNEQECGSAEKVIQIFPDTLNEVTVSANLNEIQPVNTEESAIAEEPADAEEVVDDPVSPEIILLAEGWTQFMPTVADTTTYAMSSLNQPGTRLIYISSSEGNDGTAELYFWNGTNIIDSSGSSTGTGGAEYGTDPMNPTGPIHPYKRFSYVAPRPDGADDIGTPWDGSAGDAMGSYNPEARYEYPDWWLFKRGDTFDIYEDFLSFAQETDPELESVPAGGLSVSGGESATKMQIVGAYGSLTDARPKMINPIFPCFIYRGGSVIPKHTAYISLEFDGNETYNGGGFRFNSQDDTAVNIIFEDCYFHGENTHNVVYNSGMGLTLNRCVFADIFRTDGEHGQGLYLYGKREAKLVINECIFLRNGFSHGDPRDAWPPAGSQIYDIYNRNMYLSGECNNMESAVYNTVSIIGASGDQFRPGMRVEENFFYQGYILMGADGGYPDSDGPTGTFKNNIIQTFDASGTNDNRGHDSRGLTLTMGAYDMDVTGNITTGIMYPTVEYGLFLRAATLYDSGLHFNYPVRNNRIFGNIIDAENVSSVVDIQEGVDTGTSGWNTSGYYFRGIENNEIYDNIFINSAEKLYAYQELYYTDGSQITGTSTDTDFHDNTMYASKADAIAGEGWPDSNRSLKTYMESLGYVVASYDGVPEYHDEAIQMRKGYWREEFTARPLVNYIREGFGMTELE